MPGRTPVSIVLGLAACVWALVILVAGGEVGWQHAKPFSLVVGVISLALAAFDRWIWRWPVVRGFVSRPDLEATYWGELKSQWVDPKTGEPPKPIAVAVVITQRYSRLALTLFTEDSQSSTIAATLDQGADGRFAVLGIYRNEPRLSAQPRSRIHYGGLRLDLAGSGTTLKGSYWTDRGSCGELELARLSSECAHDFGEAERMTGETSQ